ncbi:MAG: hypothetical protein KBC21_00005 [Candidatus Pacebacteria bacterium]|nr:hypothetical protein [Candidatus Paceibacterota bacterium]
MITTATATTLTTTGQTTLNTASATALTVSGQTFLQSLLSLTNASSTGGITATSFYGALLGTATLSTLDVTGQSSLANASTSNLSTTNLVATGTLSVTGQTTLSNASATNLTTTGQAYFNNSSTTVGTITSLFATNASTTNLSSTGLTSTNAFISALTATNATITNASTTNLTLLGSLFDSTQSVGTVGQVLWSTGTSTLWVSTSTLGIGGSSLTGGDIGYATRWLTATTLGTSSLLDNGTVAGINATSSSYSFNIQGRAGTNPFNVASSTGTSLLALTQEGRLLLGTTTSSINYGNLIQGTTTLIGTAGARTALRVMGNIDNTKSLDVSVNLVSSISLGVNNQYDIGNSKGFIFVASYSGNSIKSVNISDPKNPVLAGSVTIPGVQSFSIGGDYAYALSNSMNYLAVVDISNPLAMQVVSTTTVGAAPGNIYVSGSNAYVLADNNLQIFDISNPLRVELISTTPIGYYADELKIVGRYAYIIEGDGGQGFFSVLDISNPKNPLILGSIATSIGPQGLDVVGSKAYVSTHTGSRLQIIDISNPSSLSIISTTVISLGAAALVVNGRYAYISYYTDARVEIFDISLSSSPVLVDTIATGNNIQSPVEIIGRYLFVPSYATNNLNIYDIGGLETSSALVHSLEAGNLSVRNDISTGGLLNVGTALTIGRGGFYSQGNSAVYGSLTVGTSTYPNFLVNASNNTTNIGTSTGLASLFVQGTSTLNPFTVASSTGSSLFTILSDGNIGVGTTSPNSKLDVWGNLNVGTSSSPTLFANTATGNVGIGTNAPATSLQVGGAISSTRYFQVDSSGRATLRYDDNSLHTVLTLRNSGITSSAHGSAILAQISDGGVTGINAGRIGFMTENSTTSFAGTLADSAITFATAQDASLAEKMRLTSMGSLHIGAGGTSTASLRISRAVTGGPSAYSTFQDGIIQSDVTTDMAYNRTVASTVASLFTLPTLYHYNATQGTFGASSVVTNQIGYFAENTLTGATNNYGFYGAIASSTGRYNVYMNGTAANYLAGSLGVGTTSMAFKLNIDGTLGVAGQASLATASATALTATTFYNTTLYGTTALLGTTTTTFDSSKLVVQGTTTLVGTAGSPTALRVMGNIDNTATSTFAPRTLSTRTVGLNPYSIAVSGNYAYVTNSGSSTMSVLDISNPALPALLASVQVGSSPVSVYVSGGYAYVVNSGSSTLSVVDISKPASPVVVSSPTTGSQPYSVFVSGKYAYVANRVGNSLSIIDVSSPTSPVTIATQSVGNLPIYVYVSGGYAYVVNSGAGNTISIVDVTNPRSPSVVASPTVGVAPYSVYVSGRYAYVVNQSSSDLSILDISIPSSPVTMSSTAVGSAPSSIYLSGRYAYISNYNTSSVTVVDIASSTAPVIVASSTVGSNPIAAVASGRYLYVANYGSASLSILDLGGLESTSALIHSLEAGNLSVRNDITTAGMLNVGTALTVGTDGFLSQGDSAVYGSFTVGTSTYPNFLVNASNNTTNIGTSTGLASLFVQGTSTLNPFTVASSTGSSLFTILANGNVGIGTSTPLKTFSVTGSAVIASLGATIYPDSINNDSLTVRGAGSSAVTWRGRISAGGDNFAFLMGEYNSQAWLGAHTSDQNAWADFYINPDGGANVFIGDSGVSSTPIPILSILNSSKNVGIGSTTPFATLSVTSRSGMTPFVVASSSGTLLALISQTGAFVLGSSTYTGSFGELFADFITTSSTTATSTIAGNLSVGNGGIFYDASTSITSISSLELGNLSFDTNAGIVSWTDLPVTSDAATGTVESYSAQIDGQSILTIFSESDGIGGIRYPRVGVGSSSPISTFSVTGTAGDNPFVVASSTGASLFSILQSGNVGIGVTSPLALTHISSADAAGGVSTGVELLRLSATYSGTTGSGSFINFTNNTDNAVLGQIRSTTESAGNVALSFSTYNSGTSEKMRIAANGNIGIGTSTPSGKLDVISDASVTLPGMTAMSRFVSGNSNDTPLMYLEQQRYNKDVLTIRQIQTSASSYLINATSADGGMFAVNANGNVSIGTTSASSRLDVYHNTSSSNVDIFRLITDVGSSANVKFRIDSDGDLFTDGGTTINSGADLAENYTIGESGILPGMLVRLTRDEAENWDQEINNSTSTSYAISKIKKATAGDEVFGVISTNPGIILGGNTTNGLPVAFSGRVPVYVVGEVKRGDSLTVSTSTPGYAMRLTENGQSVGRALSSSPADATSSLIMMIVENTEKSFTITGVDGLSLISSTSTAASSIRDAITQRLSQGLSVVREYVAVTVKGVTGYFDTLFAKDIYTDSIDTKVICLGEEGNKTCVTKEKLDSLLLLNPNTQNTGGAGDGSSGDTGGLTGDLGGGGTVNGTTTEEGGTGNGTTTDSGSEGGTTTENGTPDQSGIPEGGSSGSTDVPPENSSTTEGQN